MLSSQKTVKIAQKINRHLELLIPITTPLAVIMGFLLSGVFIYLAPYVPWLFGFMTFSGALKLRAGELGTAVRSPKPILMFFLTAHVMMPLAAKLFSSLIFTDPDIITGFILFFSGPTAVSGFFWVMIFKGNKPLSLTLILLGTVLAPMLVPGTLSILMGETIAMNMTGIAVLLTMMVVLPTIIGVTVNELSKSRIPSVICPYLEPAAKICLVFIIAANSSSVAGKISFTELFAWKVGALCIIMLILGFFLIYMAAILIKCKRDKRVSMVMAGGLRNNSAVMTIAVAFFPDMVSLPIIMSLIFQQSIAAAVGKLLFKKKEAEEE